MHSRHYIESGPSVPDVVTAVVEIPKGSRHKCELDKTSGLFKLDRVLYSAVHYPGDYGQIPRTLFEDAHHLVTQPPWVRYPERTSRISCTLS